MAEVQVTFLFTDIQDSSLHAEHDPSGMAAAKRRHDLIVRGAIEASTGRVFNTVGDAFCAVFPLPRQALDAAVAAQRALAEEPWTTKSPLRVRMALHTAITASVEQDFEGPSLTRVKRILDLGHGGQILVSQATRELVADQLADLALKDLGRGYLRGLDRPERVYQVRGKSLASSFPPLRDDEWGARCASETVAISRRSLEHRDAFMAMRWDHLLASPGHEIFIAMTATPYSTLEEIIEPRDASVRELMWHPPAVGRGEWTIGAGEPRPSPDGLVSGEDRDLRLSIFRSGHVEFRRKLEPPDRGHSGQGLVLRTAGVRGEDSDYEERLAFDPYLVPETLMHFLSLVQVLSSAVSVGDQWSVGLALINAQKVTLHPAHPRSEEYRQWWGLVEAGRGVWTAGYHLEQRPRLFSFPVDPKRIAQEVSDRVWQAYGFPECPTLDGDGNLRY